MVKRNVVVTMFSAVFLFFIGCPADIEVEVVRGDSWTAVTSLAQVDGIWAYSSDKTQPIAEFVGNGWNDDMANAYGKMMVTQRLEVIMSIHAIAGVGSQSFTQTIAFSGGNIGTMWGLLKMPYENMGYSTDDADHSITMTQDGESPIDETDIEGAYINSAGNKLKIPGSDPLYPASSEMILTKQSGRLIWDAVKNLEQVGGTWRYSSGETKTVNNITITFSVEMTMTIDADESTGPYSATETITFFGEDIGDVWNELKTDYEGYTANDANHSLTKTSGPEDFAITDVEGMYINGEGNKLKIPAGFIPDQPAMIFTKQLGEQ